LGGEGPARRILFDGGELRGVRPDERSIAGHIGSVMKVPVPPIGHFVEVSRGISHSGGGLVQTLSEWDVEGIEYFLLDASGESMDSLPWGSDVGFVLSDDRPISEQELKGINWARKISLGDIWLQGHSCISIVHHVLDGS